MEFIMENKELLIAIVVALLSELLPFLPTKYNGLLQAIVGLLKKIGKPTAAIIVCGIILSGCVTINNASLAGEKNAVKTDADATQRITTNTDASVIPK